jgi:hypothetical protein
MLLLRAATVPNEPSPISEHSRTGLPACPEPIALPIDPHSRENEPC